MTIKYEKGQAYDYQAIQNAIYHGLKDENPQIALLAAQAAILDQMRITLHKFYLHGIPFEDVTNRE